MAPVLNIETVAAGGGSICGFNGEELFVGPESAGAHPGPACYGAGGPLTVTDVNLLLGRLDPCQFGIPVNLEAAREALEAIRSALPEPTAEEELLAGFLEIANERMADAVQKISIREGYDPAEYALVAFGGAGGQHACAIAEKLGISTVLCPSDSGLLSARGLREAVMERFSERQLLLPLSELTTGLPETIAELEQQAFGRLLAEGLEAEKIVIRRRLVSLRHTGQESAEEIEYRDGIDLTEAFRVRYESLFGYWPENKSIEVVSARVIASTELPRCSNGSDKQRTNYSARFVDCRFTTRRSLDRSGSIFHHQHRQTLAGNYRFERHNKIGTDGDRQIGHRSLPFADC